ncbi:mitochondrial inner membrane protein required for protein import [Neophaeococcomyces mojaviensis]|uniref:Mitochondrial inner membrane protein required for protein import n=1 Tax=Neophaeococcomyces mojaviensis TaxID=3383035 RepID=A0ACC3AID5_9EURO|nr:mitochondrial inner membrane protein required for protein import [Knufia sp. JES_112]
MLSRAALPLLRPRSLTLASRLSFAQCHIRGYATKGPVRPEGFKKPSDFIPATQRYHQPLRPVPASQTQNLHSSSSAFAQSQPNSSSRAGSQKPEAPSTSKQNSEPEVESSQPLPDLRDGIPSEFNTEAQPQQPLPDLTQGIPSTLDAELNQARRRDPSSKESLNITEEAADPQSSKASDRGGDGLPRSSYVSTSDRKRSALVKYFYLSVVVGGLAYGLYMGRDWDEEEAASHTDIPNGYSPALVYQRAAARFGSTMSYYKDPVTKKLLPDAALMDPNMPPFTLVLGLEDVLIRSEWSREHGWRIAKRPGLDYFLKYLSLYYELVIFSSQPSFTVDQIHRKLDPYQMVYPLFREMTVYEDGGYVKDLSYLNRDLKKVVMVESDPHAARKQPENAIILPKWDGNPNDTTLIDLIPFLEYVANMGFDDAREVLKSFEGKYIPAEFDRRQKLIREKFEAERAQKKSKKSFGGLGSLFGTKSQSPDGMQSLTEAEAQGKMIWDQIRERGHEMYQRLEKHLETEGPKIIAEREAMEKKMQDEAMASMKSGMFGWFGPGSGSGEKK